MDNWHIKLFRRSVVKQQKLGYLKAFAGECRCRSCLDLGSDNGVISHLLRQDGGDWSSADIEDRTVDMIRELVGSKVYKINPPRTPFADSAFDTVVIADLLEHIQADGDFLRDMYRIIKPGGILVINVPHRLKFSLIRRLRNALGLTDEEHGHLREGYTSDELLSLLPDGFVVEKKATYSKFFTECIDLAIALAVRMISGKQTSSAKGTLVGKGDMAKHRKAFLFFSVLYPGIWLFSRMDMLLFLIRGHRLIIRARKAGGAPESPDIETASADYAGRFSGSVGRFFLETQERSAAELLEGYAKGSSILDVGGGHGQLIGLYKKQGYRVTIAGSPGAHSETVDTLLSEGEISYTNSFLPTLPFEDASFDVAVAFRLLCHLDDWPTMLKEMCRVARHTVIVEYPCRRSMNFFARWLFGSKKGYEKNTRTFLLFSDRDIADILRLQGFTVKRRNRQFLLPMVFHRMLRTAGLSRSIEQCARMTGLSRLFGSPVITRADRIQRG